MKIISTPVLSLPLIQEGQLLAKECALRTGKLAQEQCNLMLAEPLNYFETYYGRFRKTYFSVNI